MHSFTSEIQKASAGTGKTHQLTNRIIKLLLTGVNPKNILATTFTVKAAAEISERVFLRLARAVKDHDSYNKLLGELEYTAKQFSREHVSKVFFDLCLNQNLINISTLDSFLLKLLKHLIQRFNLKRIGEL